MLYIGLYLSRLFITPCLRRLSNMYTSFYDIIGDSYYLRKKELEYQLLNALNYREWYTNANELDVLEGKMKWKENPESDLYDWRFIGYHYSWLKRMVAKKDIKGIMHYLQSYLHRNIGGTSNKQLYEYLRVGTKKLIEDYNSELVKALQLLCLEPTLTLYNKLDFFNETKHSYGRSALLLSGGGGFGSYHFGIIKSLVNNNLLPRVISGSSAGAMTAAFIATRTDAEILDMNNPNYIDLNCFDTESLLELLERFTQDGAVLDITIMQKCIRKNTGDYTFKEAFERTGRIISITISPIDQYKDMPHCLNYLTAPDVVIWSAALASSAIPYLFTPVELMCKNPKGEIVPYYAEGDIRYTDGSIYCDLPLQKLSELFNVNYSIVSQVNPHILPFILPESLKHTVFFKCVRYLWRELKNLSIHLSDLGVLPLSRVARELILQKYTGNITFVPRPEFLEYFALLGNLSRIDFLRHIQSSEVAAWRKLSHVNASLEIELTLDECVRRLNGQIIIKDLKNSIVSNTDEYKVIDKRISSWADEQFKEAKIEYSVPESGYYISQNVPDSFWIENEHLKENDLPKTFFTDDQKSSNIQVVSNKLQGIGSPPVFNLRSPKDIETFVSTVKSTHFPPFRNLKSTKNLI